MRMPQPPEKDLYVNFFRAEHTTRYLERYIREHYFDGQSLHDRIRFGFRVTKIRKAGEQWVVQGNPDTKPLYSSKVIIASGMASTPNMPVLPGESTFEAPIIHQEAFGQSSVLSSADMHNVTVLGAGKSSADMVYACVKAGKSVTWIIKKTGGTGPGFLLSPVVKGPYPDAFAIGSTRIAATTSPSTLLPETWWTNFLHRTTYGRKLVKAIWAGADKASRTAGNFYGRQNALHGFENLSPHTP